MTTTTASSQYLSTYYDEVAGEYVAVSALTGREYFGSTPRKAHERRSEAEDLYRRHWAKQAMAVAPLAA